MITGKSRIIGLVVAYLDNQFYPAAIQSLGHRLRARGYNILLMMAENSTEGVAQVVQDLMAYQVEAIITASVAMSSDLTERCGALGIPVVMFNRGQDGAGFSAITSANRAGGARVAEFLVAGGHRRIAHIAGWQGASTGRDRAQGFLAALDQAGLAPVAVTDGMYNREAAAQAARDLMRAADRPDAIFVGNDHMAFAVMDTLRSELGLSVPGDVSIVGYDDVPMAEWPAYDLTTLRQPLNRMVEATVETVLGQIEDPNRLPEKIEIAGPLILRGSARIPEGWTR
ncbi:Maltose operon transcriptional repressor MalR, LacI family [Roseibacterium elongatum DSM 19469]|uniref:Maltose operon transcriptional repressor MalR, LacI family n=1 Tax=Roseicyclus elongatus DSM 19469 TaxID=1294273 RepID=W8RWU9_9RHOB|nr:Maltose operon transcriptional repressor MalR, LacI family [Roseibacterium elongatum DSM 19469]